MTVLDAAIAYARRGIRVIPIQHATKIPLLKAWTTEASNDETIVREWFTNTYKGAGIGIATGKAANRQFFVLDIDDKNGKSGSDTLADLETEHGKLPDTVTVLTPTGGRHLYFTTTIEIRNDAGKRLGEGLDIRGIGGYVVAPPSTHENSRQYTFEHGYSILDIKPADAPTWLIHRLTSTPKIDRSKPRDHDDFLNDPNLPSSRYNASTNWHTLLTADGWTHAYQHEGTDYYIRPGKTRGISASVNHNGNDSLIVFSTNAPVPEGGYSRFGYYAQTRHGGDWKKATAEYLGRNPTPVTSTPDELLNQLVNWQDFWNQDHTSEDWIAYPLIARGRQTALFAVAKVGKSYLALACTAALATGKPIFGRPAQPPVNVLYLDYEMTPGDLLERLERLGYTEHDNLTHLHYAIIPSLPALNTYEGAAAVMKLVELTGAQVVVIDTTGRAVEGEENSADTYREFARTTGLSLKAAGIAMLRTDHAGKDKGRSGQRGSSAKNDDVDLVYHMEREAHHIKLTRLFSRITWAPNEVELVEETLEDIHPIRLKDANPSFTQRQYDLAKAILQTFPNIRPGQRHKATRDFRQQVRQAGIKYDTSDLRPALDAIHLNRTSDPLDTQT
ncbi:MAG: bifunctional DNA primase/polymerase [Pontimonas sp.]